MIILIGYALTLACQRLLKVGAGRVINDAAGISAYNSIYPNNPHPKDAVQRMENTTNPIIHISSFFMG
ncbi:uncharacterized protein Dvar_44190 [Desulfosarcina variabilis str. Montpellier]